MSKPTLKDQTMNTASIRAHKPASTRAHTTAIICENTDGYFVAFLDNGGIRVGLRDNECFDFPESHAEFKRAAALTIDTVEEAYDEYFGTYCCA